MSHRPVIRSTTILCIRKDGQVAIAGDGQVTMGQTVAKADAVKIRKLSPDPNTDVLVGFAGSAADAFALLEHFESKLKDSPGNVRKAAVELAKLWRTDRMLRRLEALLAIASRDAVLLVSGTGDVIEPSDGILGIGSGGAYATAAARALVRHSQMTAEAIARHALTIAGELCIYTNTQIQIQTLD